MDVNITKDMNLIKALAADARHESLDSAVRENMNNVIRTLAADRNPMNLYQIGQVMAYTVEELERPMSNWLDLVADHKRIGAGEEAAFRTTANGIKAFIQAKAGTTPRSRVADKQIVVDTVAVSVRPAVNLLELATGKINFGDLAMYAAVELANKKTAYVQNVLNTAASSFASPFYGTGSGIVAATFDPMVQHWMRTGGAAIIGDIAAVQKLAPLTGFTASTNTQWGNGIIEEFNRTGRIGTYKGAQVVQFVNPYETDGTTTALDKARLYIIPTTMSADARTLKVVEQGGVISVENTSINELTYEVRMDEHFGAAVCYGNTPTVSVYYDSTLG